MTETLAFVGTSDLAGLVRGKSFPAADLASRMIRGVGITHSNLMLSPFGPILATPFGTQGDLVLLPDETTRTTLPMQDGSDALLFLGDFYNLDLTPWGCCPRAFLRRALAALEAEAGLHLLVSFEQEFVYTGVQDEPGTPYSLSAFRRQGGFGSALVAAIRANGIDPDSFLAEYAPRQYELTVAPQLGLRAADEAVITRELIRAVAARMGHRAVLAPILSPMGVGNGTHIHFSLQHPDGGPATHDPAGTHGLTETAEHFVAGILHHTPSLCAVTAPSAASFCRLKPGRWAPSVADLGIRDRGSSLRICPIMAGTADSVTRQFNVEFRVADATASPYLALGAMVWAGLDGIRSHRTLASTPVAALPQAMDKALHLLERNAAARDWFGSELFDIYLMFKRAELNALEDLDDFGICERYAGIY